MFDFCYSELCNARVLAFFASPSDSAVVQPCRRCRTALEEVLGVYRTSRQKAPTLRTLYWELHHTGRAA
ncbi:hypothetical protein GCM10027517_03190 [Phycicoccus ginsengisoli]